MKNRSISFYILAMVLATGSNAQASDYVLSKDNTHVATTALKYKTKALYFKIDYLFLKL